ncbi:MAG TPA: histidine kinase, partial [Candidatus Acidoferrum sp.]|nr:histidine kinase [Candidatus Acidoferrum sp.]
MAGVWGSVARGLPALRSRADWLFAGAFTVAAELEVLTRLPELRLEWMVEAIAGLALLSFAWRRRHPVVPVALITGSQVASVIAGATVPMAVPEIALLLATYSLGAYASNIQLAVGAMLPAAMAAAIHLLLPRPPLPLLSGIAWYAIFVTGAPVFIGRLVRSRSWLVQRLERQRGALVAERDQRARLAVTAERQRISLQLRDVVIHSVDSLMADVAMAEVDAGERGLAAVVRIETIARKALGDMRPLLGALRGQDAEPLPAAEPPRLKGEPAPESARKPALLARLGKAPWPVMLAALVFVFLEARIQGPGPWHSSRLLIDLGLIAIAAPVAWSRSRPLAAATLSCFALVAVSRFVVPIPVDGLQSAVLALYLPFSVAAFSGGRTSLAGLVVCAAAFVGAYGFAAPPALVFGAAAWVAGRLLEDRTRLARELEAINRNLMEERDLRAYELVLEERLRVARELHDVIGHTLTVVVLQAGAARRNWRSDRARATRALASLAMVARGGLTELMASLDTVGGSGNTAQAGLIFRDVEALIEQARSAGVRVTFVPETIPSPVNPRLELTTYRVIQEALTNVMKYAPRSQAQVRIGSTTGSLLVEIVNSGPVRNGRGGGTRVGQGLPGMAQRVEANGGELRWGP